MQRQKNTPALYMDQYGKTVWATSRKELVEKVGGGRVSIVYVDKKDGSTVRTGYVVGSHWFSAFVPLEMPALSNPSPMQEDR